MLKKTILTTSTKQLATATYFLPITSIKYPNIGVLINGANEERLPNKFISPCVIGRSNVVLLDINIATVPDGQVKIRPRLKFNIDTEIKQDNEGNEANSDIGLISKLGNNNHPGHCESNFNNINKRIKKKESETLRVLFSGSKWQSIVTMGSAKNLKRLFV